MPAQVHESILQFDYPERATAGLVERSVAREVGEIEGGRSRASVARDGATVTVRIRASDLTALRAAQNTWTSLVEVAERAAAAGDRFRETGR